MPHPTHHEPDDSPLNRIVDDETPRNECADWALNEIAIGRSPEDVADDLAANGWSRIDAEEICEAARKQTRHLRAGASREQVVQIYGADDPNVIRNATPFAKPSMFGAVGNFLRALARFRSTKNIRKR
jgi:hypothetical protein